MLHRGHGVQRFVLLTKNFTMKKAILMMLCVSCLFHINASAQNAVLASLNSAKTFSFDHKTVDFGEVASGNKLQATFTITNTSTTEPLIIKAVKTSCGCTVAGYAKEPIAPGESTVIKVDYINKSNGYFTKTATVHTNFSEQPERLIIKGTATAATAKPASNENAVKQ